MSDVTCPYCEASQEIIHDDGYGYEEDTKHEQDCLSCGKTFIFTTHVSCTYSSFCKGEHDMRPSPLPQHANVFSCIRCDHYEVRNWEDV